MSGLLTLADAVTEITAYFYRGKFSSETEEVVEKKIQFGHSPVDLVVSTAESVYAYRENESQEAKDLAVQLIILAELPNLFNIREDNRSSKLKNILMGNTLPEDETEPEPNYQFVPRPTPEVNSTYLDIPREEQESTIIDYPQPEGEGDV